MNAKQMFEKLGYVQINKKDKSMISYVKFSQTRQQQIMFYIDAKRYDFHTRQEVFEVNNFLYKAIEQQRKELGWV